MQDDGSGGHQSPDGGSPTPSPQPVAPDHCHCNGHRLIVIIGSRDDKSIGAAMRRALQQTSVEHRIFYSAASRFNDPHYLHPEAPNADSSDWIPYVPPPGSPQRAADHPLAAGPLCSLCCFYEEATIVSHGSQQGLWSKLLGTKNEEGCLGFVFSGKPVKRLVLWICESAADVYPHKSGSYPYFEWLAYFIAPPASCPCGCDPALCQLCPHSPGCVTLLSAAWYAWGGQDFSAKLGIDPNDAAAPFESPDGRLLETQVCVTPQGRTTTESTLTQRPGPGDPGITVFNGLKVKANAGLKSGGRVITPENHIGNKGKSGAIEPTKFRKAPYLGPHACPGRDGCLHN
jgi:hypothetical protein